MKGGNGGNGGKGGWREEMGAPRGRVRLIWEIFGPWLSEYFCMDCMD